MIDHPAAQLFTLVAGVLPGGLLLWACDVTSWISWLTLIFTCFGLMPGAGIFVMGYWREKPKAVLTAMVFLIPALLALGTAASILWLGGSGPDAGLHWGWMFLYLPLGMWVGMAGIFAGAAFGNA